MKEWTLGEHQVKSISVSLFHLFDFNLLRKAARLGGS